MTTVAVTGGIGCGKSTVTGLLREHGAAVVDADVVAREVVADGSEVLDAVVASFGQGVLDARGSLDRAALARAAFASPDATARLNELVHPAIGRELARQVAEARAASKVVVVAIPLYRAEHRDALGVDLVVCVDCDPADALDRLVAGRGMDREDAELRMAAQPSRDERLALADVVVANTGSTGDLRREVDALWDRLVG